MNGSRTPVANPNRIRATLKEVRPPGGPASPDRETFVAAVEVVSTALPNTEVADTPRRCRPHAERRPDPSQAAGRHA